jgi:hypothetical protein
MPLSLGIYEGNNNLIIFKSEKPFLFKILNGFEFVIPRSGEVAVFVESSVVEDLIWFFGVKRGIRTDPRICFNQFTSHSEIRNQIASRTIKLATFVE